MIPPVVLAVGLGSPFMEALMTVAAVGMAWEWSRLVERGQFGFGGMAMVTVVVVAIFLASSHSPAWGAAFVLGGVILVVGMATLAGQRSVSLQGVGTLYVGFPCLALIWLRLDPETGLISVLWLLLVVWATDIGAYVAGSKIGGPKIWTAISPKKTWAGLIGGMVGAALVGGILAGVASEGSIFPTAVISAGLAIVAQAGDFFESGMKRHFGVKDSSNLIPGHGGILDRVDGLITAALAVAGLKLLGLEGLPL